jgi:hypothetical protein
MNTYMMDRFLNTFTHDLGFGSASAKLMTHVNKNLIGRDTVYETANGGPKWWQDVFADSKIDRTLKVPAHDRRLGKLKYHDMNGVVTTVGYEDTQDLTEDEAQHMVDLLREDMSKVSRKEVSMLRQHLHAEYRSKKKNDATRMPPTETTVKHSDDVTDWASRINLCKMYELRYESSEWFDHMYDIVINAKFRDWDTFLGTTLDKLIEYASTRTNASLDEIERRKELIRMNPALELHVIGCRDGRRCKNKYCTYVHM